MADVRVGDLDPSTPGGGWSAYPLGVIWALAQHGEVGGVDVLIDGAVPLGAGLSSSAALECAVACAAAELFGLERSPTELALSCQAAENEFVGVPCGVMDQFASMLCAPGHALFLDTRSLSSRAIPLDPAASGCTLLVIDTKVRHTLAASAYADRRRACEEAARRLGVRALRDVSVAELPAALRALDDAELCRRTRHVVRENARVLGSVDLLENGRLRDIGPVLSAAHASLRDDFEVSCRELDVAAAAAEAAGALGARMVGGGFGGSVLALVETADEGAVRASTTSVFAELELHPPEITRVELSGGARREA
jgi:galactokinase